MSYRIPETGKITPLADAPVRPEVERPAHASVPTLAAAPGLRSPGTANVAESAKIVDETLLQISQGYQFKARASNTRRAYANDFRRFQEWCEAGGYDALPATPETVAFYLADHAEDYAVASLRRWLVGISLAHKEAGLVTPTATLAVRDTLKGIRREAVEQGREPRRAYPLVIAALRQMVEPIPLPNTSAAPVSLIDLRDRALLTLAWTCALRSSEVGGIRVSDLRDTAKGFVVTFRKSKTNQEGKPHLKAMPHAQAGNEDVCPNLALRAWLAAMPRTEQKNRPVFAYVDRHGNVGQGGITPQSVNRIIRARARQAGFPEEVIERVTCHSLRRGFATSTALGKANEHKTLKHIGWRDARMYRHYVEEAELFEDNPATSAGL